MVFRMPLMTRSRFLVFLSLALLMAGAALPGSALADASAEETSPAIDAAVARGLAFLAKGQAADGSFEVGGYSSAMTGLSIMAFLANGDVPNEGRYGSNVRSAVDFLLSRAPADGYFGTTDSGRMYTHGIVTLALAEAYGVEHDPERQKKMREVLVRAVEVILKAQDVAKPPPAAGGWRYEPQQADSDLSLSGWNALALRAAQSAGISVPKDRVQRAIAYVLNCYRADRGGFAYQPNQEPSVAMTGVGVLNLYLLDAAQRPEALAGARYLAEHALTEDTRMPYYALYYSTQAAYQAGEVAWPAVWKVTQSRLLPAQNKADGGWPQSRSTEEPGRTYATAMSVLTLSVPYRLLPIYQR